MTFEDDFLHIHFQGGVKQYACKDLGFDWPPPVKIKLHGFEFELTNRSTISDEQRAQMTHVCRGAEYILCDKQTIVVPPFNQWN